MAIMDRYQVQYYDRFACEEKRFYVIAKHKKNARDLFLKFRDRKALGLSMEDIHVYKYYDPTFWTEQKLNFFIQHQTQKENKQ